MLSLLIGFFLLAPHPSYETVSCPQLAPSTKIPRSVRHLRPGDIEVVAALGDSFTIGKGARANSVHQLQQTYSGLAFPIGGDSGQQTIPNFFRHYNSFLYGYSEGYSFTREHMRFNMAEAEAISGDLMNQVSGAQRRYVYTVMSLAIQKKVTMGVYSGLSE